MITLIENFHLNQELETILISIPNVNLQYNLITRQLPVYLTYMLTKSSILKPPPQILIPHKVTTNLRFPSLRPFLHNAIPLRILPLQNEP